MASASHVTLRHSFFHELFCMTDQKFSDIYAKFIELSSGYGNREVLRALSFFYFRYDRVLAAYSTFESVAVRYIIHFCVLCTNQLHKNKDEYRNCVTPPLVLLIKAYYTAFNTDDANFIKVTNSERNFIGRILNYTWQQLELFTFSDTPNEVAVTEFGDYSEYFVLPYIPVIGGKGFVDSIIRNYELDPSYEELVPLPIKEQAEARRAERAAAEEVFPSSSTSELPSSSSSSSLKEEDDRVENLFVTLFYGDLQSLTNDDWINLKKLFSSGRHFDFLDGLSLDMKRVQECIIVNPNVMGLAISYMIHAKVPIITELLENLISCEMSPYNMVALVRAFADCFEKGLQLSSKFVDQAVTACLRFLEHFMNGVVTNSDEVRLVRLVITALNLFVVYEYHAIKLRFGEIQAMMLNFSNVRIAAMTYNRIVKLHRESENSPTPISESESSTSTSTSTTTQNSNPKRRATKAK